VVRIFDAKRSRQRDDRAIKRWYVGGAVNLKKKKKKNDRNRTRGGKKGKELAAG